MDTARTGTRLELIARARLVLVASLALAAALTLADVGPECRHTSAHPWGCVGRVALVGLVGLPLLIAITTWAGVYTALTVGWDVLVRTVRSRVRRLD